MANLPVIFVVCTLLVSGLQAEEVHLKDGATILIDAQKYLDILKKTNKTDCTENEEFRECGKKCVLACRQSSSTLEIILSKDECEKSECVKGCFCKDGLVRQGDKCVPATECSARQNKAIEIIQYPTLGPPLKLFGLFRPNNYSPPNIHIHNHNEANNGEDDCPSGHCGQSSGYQGGNGNGNGSGGGDNPNDNNNNNNNNNHNTPIVNYFGVDGSYGSCGSHGCGGGNSGGCGPHGCGGGCGSNGCAPQHHYYGGQQPAAPAPAPTIIGFPWNIPNSSSTPPTTTTTPPNYVTQFFGTPQSTTRNANGSTTYTYPGFTVTANTNGSYTISNNNGATTTYYPNGTQVTGTGTRSGGSGGGSSIDETIVKNPALISILNSSNRPSMDDTQNDFDPVVEDVEPNPVKVMNSAMQMVNQPRPIMNSQQEQIENVAKPSTTLTTDNNKSAQNHAIPNADSPFTFIIPVDYYPSSTSNTVHSKTSNKKPTSKKPPKASSRNEMGTSTPNKANSQYSNNSPLIQKTPMNSAVGTQFDPVNYFSGYAPNQGYQNHPTLNGAPQSNQFYGYSPQYYNPNTQFNQYSPYNSPFNAVQNGNGMPNLNHGNPNVQNVPYNPYLTPNNYGPSFPFSGEYSPQLFAGPVNAYGNSQPINK